MDIIDKYADTFFAETAKLLDEFEALLLSNESAKAFSSADINEMFRITHTLKGSFAMMAFQNLLALSHALEDIFVMLKREAVCDLAHGALFDVLYEALDAMRTGVDEAARGGMEIRAYDGLIGRIKAFSEAESSKLTLRIRLKDECVLENVRSYLIVSTLKGLCPSLTYYPEALDSDPDAARKIRSEGLYISFPAASRAIIDETLQKELFVESAEPAVAFPNPAAPEQKKAAPEANDVSPGLAGGGYATVSLAKIDKLGVIADEMLLLQSKVIGESALSHSNADAIRLKRSSETLQSAIVSLRMVPISTLFQKLHLAVREAGKKLARQIDFVSRGADVEIDKGIIDALSESLVQIVRNAVVHGIEPAEERLKAGKPLMGVIEVSARNSGTSVVVTVRDDGRGISGTAIARAAGKAGIETGGVPVSNEEILGLIVRPGVTTNSEADELSGRGVGLDVVNSAVEKLRGSLSLETSPGFGTSFIVRIPQSLAVMDCICLGAGESVFLLPRLDVYTLVRSSEADVMRTPNGGSFVRFRGYNLPVIDLKRLYGLTGGEEDDSRGVYAIIEGDDCAAAIGAERVPGPVKAAVKPLPALCDLLGVRKRGICGCAVLNGGAIGLILDAEALLTIARE